MEFINDFDEFIRRLDEAVAVRRLDIDAGAAMCSKICFVPPEEIVTAVMAHPPGSKESYDVQMKLIYEKIAGYSHRTSLEGHDSSHMTAENAFPFCLSPQQAGYWTMSYGYLLNVIDLPERSKVLEIGFGSGGLSEIFARTGFDVTAVEVRESNCITLKARADLFSKSVHCIASENLFAIDYNKKFDAIVFFEAFHHMPAPQNLLAHLSQFLSPSGVFVFGAEPIQPASALIPFPWGFRMDGPSLGAIRDVGWVEFGFHDKFFIEMLSSLGFTTQRHNIEGICHCDVWIARRA